MSFARLWVLCNYPHRAGPAMEKVRQVGKLFKGIDPVKDWNSLNFLHTPPPPPPTPDNITTVRTKFLSFHRPLCSTGEDSGQDILATDIV